MNLNPRFFNSIFEPRQQFSAYDYHLKYKIIKSKKERLNGGIRQNIRHIDIELQLKFQRFDWAQAQMIDLLLDKTYFFISLFGTQNWDLGDSSPTSEPLDIPFYRPSSIFRVILDNDEIDFGTRNFFSGERGFETILRFRSA